jgi:hypothetical protein
MIHTAQILRAKQAAQRFVIAAETLLELVAGEDTADNALAGGRANRFVGGHVEAEVRRRGEELAGELAEMKMERRRRAAEQAESAGGK